jgi:subtilisin family serine protease
MAGRILTLATLVATLLFSGAVDAAPKRKADAGPKTNTFLGVPISNSGASNLIANKYIVVYNNTFSSTAIEAHQASIMASIAKRNIGKRSLDGRTLSTQVNTFAMGKWHAMSLEADDAMMNEIFEASEVSYIEQDAWVNLTATTTETNAPSGLVRLSHAATGATGYVFDTTAGEGITAYVVDTGIMTTHEEFEGRATFGANFVNKVVR